MEWLVLEGRDRRDWEMVDLGELGGAVIAAFGAKVPEPASLPSYAHAWIGEDELLKLVLRAPDGSGPIYESYTSVGELRVRGMMLEDLAECGGNLAGARIAADLVAYVADHIADYAQTLGANERARAEAAIAAKERAQELCEVVDKLRTEKSKGRPVELKLAAAEREYEKLIVQSAVIPTAPGR